MSVTAPPFRTPWKALGYAIARLGTRRCQECGRRLQPRGPCAPDDCSVLGASMKARLRAREDES